MTEIRRVKAKVVLVGDEAARKTDLIRPCVAVAFNEGYIRTMGVVVSAKTVNVDVTDWPTSLRMDIRIHDVLGKLSVAPLFKDAYFPGTQGVLAVGDVAQPQTVHDLRDWIDATYSVTGSVPTYILVRSGMEDLSGSLHEAVVKMAANYHAPFAVVSSDPALAEDVVEGAFRWLAERIAARLQEGRR